MAALRAKTIHKTTNANNFILKEVWLTVVAKKKPMIANGSANMV
jgi:hypothetical protein